MNRFSWLVACGAACIVLFSLLQSGDTKRPPTNSSTDPQLPEAVTASSQDQCQSPVLSEPSQSDPMPCGALPLESLSEPQQRPEDPGVGTASEDLNSAAPASLGPILGDPDDVDTDRLYASLGAEPVSLGPRLGNPDDAMTTQAADTGGERSIGIAIGEPNEIDAMRLDSDPGIPVNLGMPVGNPADDVHFDLEGRVGSLGEPLPGPEEAAVKFPKLN